MSGAVGDSCRLPINYAPESHVAGAQPMDRTLPARGEGREGDECTLTAIPTVDVCAFQLAWRFQGNN